MKARERLRGKIKHCMTDRERGSELAHKTRTIDETVCSPPLVFKINYTYK